jgi:hypothetical protein
MKKMNLLAKGMSQGEFQSVYEKLDSLNYSYSLDDFTRDFGEVRREIKFAYLHYAIAKNEIPLFHILICDMLEYTDTFFFDIYTV